MVVPFLLRRRKETHSGSSPIGKKVNDMAKYKEWLTEEGLLKIGAWARDGLTKEQIAENIGISRDTLNTWEKKFPDISDTIKKSREVADIIIENALFEKAKGGKQVLSKPVKVKKVEYKDGKKVKEEENIQYVFEEVYNPPDTAAIIFYLKNRLPDKWKDKQGIDLSGSIDTELDNLSALVKQMCGDG